MVLSKKRVTIAGKREEYFSPPSPAQLWRWLSQQNLEAVFTLITLVAMILAWGANRLQLPPFVSTSLYILAYITGGAFGLKQGIASLREGVIDIDLLMILAALGAAIVGAPF